MKRNRNIGSIIVIGCFALMAAWSSAANADTEYLQGTVQRTEFRVPAGHRVVATGDLTVVCSVEAEVDGLISADPGVSVKIVSPSTIVRGTIRGGDGLSGRDVLEQGQDGGSVVLDSPYILLDGAILRAGRGGNGGRGGTAAGQEVAEMVAMEHQQVVQGVQVARPSSVAFPAPAQRGLLGARCPLAAGRGRVWLERRVIPVPYVHRVLLNEL